MVRRAQLQHVPIILCTVPVNLRDWLPTVSFNHLNGDSLHRWQELYREGRRGLLEDRLEDGIRALRAALALEGDHAESYFWLGRLLEAKGEKAAAAEAYSRARDLDYNPFRALSSFNQALRSLAQANRDHGVYLLDLDSIFAQAARGAAPGFDLFLDYVHPTKTGNLLVASQAYELFTRGVSLPIARRPSPSAAGPTIGTQSTPWTRKIGRRS
jgi:tetratricopeptide (TPR) repeat protein